MSVDTQGRPLFINSSLNANDRLNAGDLVGYPCYYNTGVSGKYYRQGNAVQTLTVTATGGSYTLTIGGATTGAIAFNANAAAIQTAVQAAGAGGVFGGDPAASTATVTGTGPFTVTLGIGSAPTAVNTKSLTGGTATITPAASTDSGLRAIGGDFSQCAYGVGMDISIKVSSEASYTPDGGTTWVSAFQNNLVLLLVEAYYGFVVNDPNAFVSYTHAVGS